MWPALDQFFARGAPLPLRGLGCARLASLAFAPPRPRRGKGGWKKDNLQKEFYTPEFCAIGVSFYWQIN